MQPLVLPTPQAPGGWGRLVRRQPGRSAFFDETAERFACELAGESLVAAARLERHRRPAAERPGELSRTHATLAFLDLGTYLVQRDGAAWLADPLSVAIFAPFAGFTFDHPHGGERRGLSVFLSDDLFFGEMPTAIERAWPAVAPASMRTLVVEQVLRRTLRGRGGDRWFDGAVRVLWRSVRRDLAAAPAERRTGLRRATAERHAAAVGRAKAHLSASHRRAVALDEVARAAYVSVFYLTRIFRRRTGLTLHAYLTRLRVRAALIGIADPRLLLDEVGRSVGYASQSHFTRIVRQTVGRPPRELRELVLEAAPEDPAFERLAD